VKTWLTVLLVVFSDAAGNIANRQGMKQVGEMTVRHRREVLPLLRRFMTNRLLGMGVLFMAVAFFLFLALLSWANLSFVLPATSIGYAVNALGARFILKEKVTAERWVGTVFICVGIVLISLSPVGR